MLWLYDLVSEFFSAVVLLDLLLLAGSTLAVAWRLRSPGPMPVVAFSNVALAVVLLAGTLSRQSETEWGTGWAHRFLGLGLANALFGAGAAAWNRRVRVRRLRE